MNRRKLLQALISLFIIHSDTASIFAVQQSALNTRTRRKALGIGRKLVTSTHPDFSALESLLSSTSADNVMETLFIVFKGSIDESIRDKNYFLGRLKLYHDMGEALSDYLSVLADLTGNSTDSGKNKPCPPTGALRATYRLEKSLNGLELKIKTVSVKKRIRPDIKALRNSLKRDRLILRKAQALYRKQKTLSKSCK